MRPHSLRGRTLRFSASILFSLVVCASGSFASPQTDVTGRIEILNGASSSPAPDASQVVVWLVPLSRVAETPAPQPQQQLIQRHKSFVPHLLVVQAGSMVQFPNDDPFFHNVFSLFEGKRFDLGLYEAGSTRSVLFDKPGICYLFCNIHPEMSAVVVVLKTPYYAISDRSGTISIPNVPPGRYELHVWYERALPDELNHLSRAVTLSDDAHLLGVISVRANPHQNMAHKNKYGMDYDDPTPPGSLYTQP